MNNLKEIKMGLELSITELATADIDNDDGYKISLCKDILLIMNESPDLWSSLCPYNYSRKDVVHEFVNDLRKPFFTTGVFNNSLLFMSLLFLREAMLFENFLDRRDIRKIELWNRFLRSYSRLSETIVNPFISDDSFDNNLLGYILMDLSIDVLSHHLRSKKIKAFIEYDNLVERANIELNNFSVSIEDKIKKAEKLEKKLDDIKTGENFVSLSKGFSRLLKKKSCAKNITAFILLMLGLTALTPVGYEAYKLSEFYVNKENFSFSWQEMLPIFGLELILIYFFRIVLNHYFSLQTQIMQLDLRLSLCQFIQSYASYAKEIKSDDKDALEKFENLIFSSIVSDPKKVPGTFDGVESLASLVQALKGDKS